MAPGPRTPVKPRRMEFSTDGCTMWPDGAYRSCCEMHDYVYWRGGSFGDRLSADRDLRACVSRLKGPLMAWTMFLGVRVGGCFCWPVPWRWGYGHKWPFWK